MDYETLMSKLDNTKNMEDKLFLCNLFTELLRDIEYLKKEIRSLKLQLNYRDSDPKTIDGWLK